MLPRLQMNLNIHNPETCNNSLKPYYSVFETHLKKQQQKHCISLNLKLSYHFIVYTVFYNLYILEILLGHIFVRGFNDLCCLVNSLGFKQRAIWLISTPSATIKGRTK